MPRWARHLALAALAAPLLACTGVWDLVLARDLQADIILLMGEAGLDPAGLDCATVSGSRRGHCSLGVRNPDDTEALATLLGLTETPISELRIGEADACLSRPEHAGDRPLEAWVGSRLPAELDPLDLSGPLGQFVLVRDPNSGQSCLSADYLYG